MRRGWRGRDRLPDTWSDIAGVDRDTRWARRLGYVPRSLVDPAHAAVINGLLAPDVADVSRAEEIGGRVRGRAPQGRGAGVELDARWSKCRPIPMPSVCLRVPRHCGNSNLAVRPREPNYARSME